MAVLAFIFFNKGGLISKQNDRSGFVSGKAAAVLPVRAMIMQEAPLKDVLVAAGTVMADEQVEIAAEAPGRITHIHFAEGSSVKAGDLLVTINNADLLAQAERNTFQLRLAESRERLHLLGGGSQEGALRALVDRLALHDAVQFHGRLDDAGMAVVLARCKLSISVPESDATSVSVLESMACGLAVIASDLPANREWLQAEALVPVGDTEALAARWLALLRDDTRAAAWGAENAERIARDGDRRVQMDAMDALYRRLLREPAR